MSEFDFRDTKLPKAKIRRKTKLIAGALALGAAGALAAQTAIPSGQYALADPVTVNSATPMDFSDVVKAVSPAVVSVKIRSSVRPANLSGESFGDFRGFENLPEGHPLERFFRRFGGDDFRSTPRPNQRRFSQGQGSGFFITDDGYVVTNEHVVRGADDIIVVMNDGEELEAELVGSDERSDIAVLKVNADEKFTYVKFADQAPEVGEWVVTVGNPFGLGGTVTAGIVSARGRDIGAGPYDDFIQIDAPVNRGNSGGPAFNLKGEVIGVNAAIFSPSGGNVGIAFAIPATLADTIVSDLKEDGTVVRGWLGVQIQPINADIADSIGLENAKGALIADPQPDSPAEDAGLSSGDAILEVNGEAVEGPRELARMIADYTPGTEVDVTLWRNGAEKVVSVELGELPGAEANASSVSGQASPTELSSLGIELQSAKSADAGEEGVVVTGINPDSAAEEKGLQVGTVILEVAGEKVNSPAEVEKLVREAKQEGRKAVLMRMKQGENSRFVALPVGRA